MKLGSLIDVKSCLLCLIIRNNISRIVLERCGQVGACSTVLRFQEHHFCKSRFSLHCILLARYLNGSTISIIAFRSNSLVGKISILLTVIIFVSFSLILRPHRRFPASFRFHFSWRASIVSSMIRGMLLVVRLLISIPSWSLRTIKYIFNVNIKKCMWANTPLLI